MKTWPCSRILREVTGSEQYVSKAINLLATTLERNDAQKTHTG